MSKAKKRPQKLKNEVKNATGFYEAFLAQTVPRNDEKCRLTPRKTHESTMKMPRKGHEMNENKPPEIDPKTYRVTADEKEIFKNSAERAEAFYAHFMEHIQSGGASCILPLKRKKHGKKLPKYVPPDVPKELKMIKQLFQPNRLIENTVQEHRVTAWALTCIPIRRVPWHCITIYNPKTKDVVEIYSEMFESHTIDDDFFAVCTLLRAGFSPKYILKIIF